MHHTTFPACAVLLLLVTAGNPATAQATKQPGKALICLTYDDGLESHLATVVPQLDSFGLKGTFFLNGLKGSAEVIGQSSPALVGWRKAAQHGHELANHTLFHPCPQAVGWPPEEAINGYTTDRIVEEVRIMDAQLRLVDGQQRRRAFAYPCNNTLVAGADYGPALQKSGLVSFARVGGDRTSVVTDLRTLDPQHVPSWMVEEGTTLNELVAFARKAKAASGLAVYQFHGVGGQFFRISSATHRAFLQYLKDHPQDYEVTTFSKAMQQLASH